MKKLIVTTQTETITEYHLSTESAMNRLKDIKLHNEVITSQIEAVVKHIEVKESQPITSQHYTLIK